jgi:hypothetical protein
MSPSHLSQVNHFSLLNTYGRYKEGHARRHWEETEHCYSLELETQRVWDYAGDNYVHRLIQSKTDGKLVELNSHGSLSKDGCGSCEYSDSGMTDALLNSKVDMIISEYNELLQAQLENQKQVSTYPVLLAFCCLDNYQSLEVFIVCFTLFKC